MTRLLPIFLLFLTFGFNSSVIFAQANTPSTGNDAEIIERFWQVLVKSPRFGTSFDRVYAYYSDAGELDTLIEKTRKLTLGEPNKGENFLLQGMFLTQQNEMDKTIACYLKAEVLLLDDPTPSSYLADVFISQGRLQEAADAIERALTKKNRKNETIALLQKLGWTYERLGQQEKADDTWQKIEQLFPNDINVLSRIAETLEREGKYPEALRMYEKLMALARTGLPKDNNSYVRFGLAAADIKIRLGNKQDAIDDFERLLDGLNEKSWASDNIRNRIERIFVRNGDYLGLARYYQQRLERRTDDIEILRRYAIVLVRLSHYDEAAKLLQNAIEKAPSDIPLKLLLVELLSLQGRFAEAEATYAQINRLAPGSIDYLTQWGLVVFSNSDKSENLRREETAAIWSQIADIDPNDAVMTLSVARLFADHGFDVQAETFFQKAITLKPNDAALYEHLGHFYHRKNMPEKAVQTFRQIAAESRRNVDSLLQLAGVFEKLNLTEETVQSLYDATEISPDRFDLRIRLAEACFELPDLDAVQTQLAAAEKLAQSDDEIKRFVQCETRWLLETNTLSNAARQLGESLANNNMLPESRAKLHWKLAVYHSTLGETDAAIRAIEAAIADDVNSLLILQTAAEIAKKSQASQDAANLLWRLVELDKSRRIEHLQSLAILYRDLGELDKTIDTANQILQTGTKNAAHYRAQAELLFSIDRNDLAINALRLALKVDPNDHATLALLADVLFDTGRTEEAVEPAWRIFDRAENLEMKMAAVDRLVVYYRQMGRFDQLIGRLHGAADRAESTSNIGQKEIAYCTARAYSGISDYESARKTLESLLLVGDSDASGDAILLEHLSAIAEIQGDLEGAIHFQEMLIEGQETDAAFERLLALYYENRNHEKATALLKRKILDKKELRAQLDMADSLLAREEYDTAVQILDTLVLVHGEHWELLARQMMLQNWTHSPNASETAQRLLAITLPLETQAAVTTTAISTVTPLATLSTAPWRLGELPIGASISVDFNQPESLRQYAVHLAGTVFREHIVPDRRYAGRSTMPKPEPVFDSLFDVKLLAEVVLLKSAVNTDQRESNMAALKQIEDVRRFILSNKAADVNAMKKQYVMELLFELFDTNEPLSLYYQFFSECVSTNAAAFSFADQMAVKLALALQGETSWENEGLLQLLDRFANHAADIQNSSEVWDWLLVTLNEKIKRNDFAASKDIWEKAVLLDVALSKTNGNANAKAFTTIIAEAGNRSYIVRLLQAEQANDFAAFVSLIRQAVTQSTTIITENRPDNPVYTDFSQAFENHLDVQRQRWFATHSPVLAGQLNRTIELWHANIDRVQYGQKTLHAFFSNDRRKSGFTKSPQPPVSPETVQACEQYEAYAYQVLDFWLSLDTVLQPMDTIVPPAKSSSNLAAGNAWFTVADLRRQINRDKPVTLNIVSYLVNRSVFGAAVGTSRCRVGLDVAASMASMDKHLLETQHGNRLQRFAIYLNECEMTAASRERNDFARVGEMIVASQQTDQPQGNNTEIESPTQLRQKAEKRLAELENRNGNDTVPVLIALTLVELASDNTEKALEILEKIPCRRPAEMKARELFVLELTLRSDHEIMAAKRETAIQKLAGYQLAEDELMSFWTMLKEIHRTDMADMMLNRLLTIAASPANRQVLLAELREKAEHDPQAKERLVAFAIKIFRSTPKRGTLASDAATEQARSAAIEALDWSGKLDEIAGQLAAQVENAPGAVAFLMQLAELNLQAGRTQDARQQARQIAENMPNDSATMLDYAKFLARLEMYDEASQWTEKALIGQSDLFFAQTDEYRKMLGSHQTLELLAKFDPPVIAKNAFGVFSLLKQSHRIVDTRQDTQKLFDRFWNEKTLSTQELASLRQTAVRSLSDTTDGFFYPYYRQWMLDIVTEENFSADENPIFKVTYWVDHQPKTFASTFFQLAKANGKLEEFLRDIQKTDSAVLGRAKILETAAFFALGQTAKGLECVKSIEKRHESLLTEALMTLGLCLDLGGSPDADVAFEYYERAFQANPHRAYEYFYTSRFCVLGLQSKQPERREFALQQTTAALRQMLSAIENLGDKTSVSLEAGYFSQDALIYFSELYTTALAKAGQDAVVQKIHEDLDAEKSSSRQN